MTESLWLAICFAFSLYDVVPNDWKALDKFGNTMKENFEIVLKSNLGIDRNSTFLSDWWQRFLSCIPKYFL